MLNCVGGTRVVSNWGCLAMQHAGLPFSTAKGEASTIFLFQSKNFDLVLNF